MNTMMATASPVPEVEKRALPPTEMEIRTTKKRLSRARTTVASFCRFFGHLILKTTPIVAMPEDKVDTAAVAPDGTMYFNAHYVAELSDAELCGLVIHETLHPALLCWKRQGGRKALVQGPPRIVKVEVKLPNGKTKIETQTVPGAIYTLWNVAHDLSFNPEIVDLASKCLSNGKIRLPKHAAIDPQYKGMSAEQIYAILLEIAKKNKKDADGAGARGAPSPWGTPGQGSGSGKPIEGYLDVKGTQGASDEIGDDIREDLAKSDLGKKAAKGDKLAKQKISNNWRVSVVAAAMAHQKKHGRGHLPAGFQALIDGLTTPKVDWRDVLSKWIGEQGINIDFTMRRPARRSESVGVYMPSYQKYGIDDVIVLWDTSGSMGGREKRILTEVNEICEGLDLTIRVICCDAAIHTDTRDVKAAIDIIGKIKGGGGSDFNPAFDLLEEEQYQGVIVCFTDGHIGVPPEKPPLIKDVLWCLEPSDSKHSWGDQDPTRGQWGTVLYMKD